MKRKINTEFTVFVIGNEYMDLDDFAGDLYADYGINALTTTNLPFAKQIVDKIDNAVGNTLFIHLTLPTEKLAKRIAECEGVDFEGAIRIAEDINLKEEIIDFDESTPDDLCVITYTGESDTVGLDRFVDICADIIEKNSAVNFEWRNFNHYERV